MEARPERLAWLTPARCRLTLAALLAFNLFTSWRFLTRNCPIDLSGDEAQYWTWSRHLALGYYSKPPMVAALIRAGCAALGNTMPAVRLPALVLAVGTSVCTYWLTLKLFASDRLAVGAVLLGAVVPMFAAGGVLMTIDPPLYFFWALSTCFAAKAIVDDRRWPWVAAGVTAALGTITKWGMPLWLLLVLSFLATDRPSRRWLRTPWPWAMCGLALLGFVPPLIWNAGHGWVTFKHVLAQTGAANGLAEGVAGLRWWQRGNPLAFVGAQFGAVNPAVVIFMLAAVGHALVTDDANARGRRLLLILGGGFWLLTFADSLVAKVQPNWPAPAYFTLLILTAHFVATRRRDRQTWQRWRGLAWFGVAFGLLAGTLLRDTTLLYPAVARVDRRYPGVHIRPANFDPSYKFRGIADPLATTVAAELARLRPGAFVLTEAYEDAAQLEFYLPGQPATYFAGSYWAEVERAGRPIRRRWTQFDVWPDRDLSQPALRGKDAVYVGLATYPPLVQSFETVTPLPDITVRLAGLDVRTWKAWRCTGFKGMARPAGAGPR